MKKFVFALLSAAMLPALAACNKSEIDDDTPEEPVADYTVIFWGMCGTNDYGVAADLYTVAENYVTGRIGDNVNIAGLVKTSVNLSDSQAADFDKTYYFDSAGAGRKSLNDEDMDVEDVVDIYNHAFAVLNAKPYADTAYPLNDTDSLATFIRKTAAKYPAHNYVLMLLGHGGGFSPAEETPLTKACLYDNYRDGEYLTADAVVGAAQKSGVHIQTIFTQCCLMATLENIAAYSQAFDYGILAAEVTYSYYFPEYLVKLSAAGNDEQKMQAASRELVDYYVGTLASDPTAYSTHGFYNLGKTTQLLAAVKDLASWYSGNFPALQEQIEDAVSKTIFCNNLEGAEDTEALRSEREFIQAILNGDDLSELLGGMTFSDFMLGIAQSMADLVGHSISYGFPFAHLLAATYAEIEDTPQKSGFETKAEKYMQVLRDMAYIRANPVPEGAESDYEYLYCSPTINIFALNKQYFIPISMAKQEEFVQAVNDEDVDKAAELMEEMFGGSIFANYVSFEQAYANYTSSVFDRNVKWSEFLKQLEMNPSVLYNPDRRQIDESIYATAD